MGGRTTFLAIALLISFGITGCTSCAPKDTFSCLDRYCFLPDWTNCNSCDSECWRKDGYNYHWGCPCQDPERRPPVYVQ
jgi:hypothetical protein